MRKRLDTVRVRTTVAATLVVALALGAASLSLVVMLRATMISNIDASLELRAADIGAIIESGTLPDSVAIEGEEMPSFRSSPHLAMSLRRVATSTVSRHSPTRRRENRSIYS